MLVFGLGHDSAYWNRANSGGYTVFVEDSAEWISTIRAEHPELEGKIFQYTYKTRLAKDGHRNGDYWFDRPGSNWESLFMFDELPPDSPLVTLQGKFDVVIVDAPMGMDWCPTCPSRLQSLWTARVMVRPGGHIVVDDCERMLEQSYARRFYGEGTVAQMLSPSLRNRPRLSGRVDLVGRSERERRGVALGDGAGGRPVAVLLPDG